MKKVLIVGYGYVGKAYAHMLRGHVELYIVDPVENPIYPAERMDLAIVCVPTPSLPDGKCDVSIVDEVLQLIDAKVIMIKSALAPGSATRMMAVTGLDLVISPEYIGEAAHYVPPQYPNPTNPLSHGFMILGGDAGACAAVADIFSPIVGPTCRFRFMSAVEAELVKYMENAWIGVKVTFINEVRAICERMGANWHQVREGWLDDPRVSPSHTSAYKDKPGFDGKCIPKDLRGLAAVARQLNMPDGLLAAALKSNDAMRGAVK